MKRALLTFAISALMVTSAHAEKIGVSMALFDDNFLTNVRESMKTQADQQKGVQIQFEDAQNDIGRQLSQIQNFIAEKVDAIIVVAVDTDATPQMTKLAASAGIPLVYANRRPADKTLPPKVAFIGSDDREAGTLQMQEVCKMLNGKGQIVVMMGELSNQAARQRTQYVREVVSKPPCTGIRIVEQQTGNWKRTEGADLMTNWLSAGIKPDAVVSNNDEMAIGAILSLKQAGMKMDKVVVAGVDATQDALAAMKAGDLAVTVFQNGAAQGSGAVNLALKLANGGKVPPYTNVPYELVTRANLVNFMKK